MGAALVAVGVGLSGCASAGGEEEPTATTTSSASAEESGNPWDLPIEQRPALFDPCAEIPVDAVEDAVGRPVSSNDVLMRHEPDELMACGWVSDQVHLTVAASWKTRSQYLEDAAMVTVDHDGRGLKMTEAGDQTDSTCLQVFFTQRGSTWVKLDIVTGLGEFRGERFVAACDALDQALAPLVELIPEGDF
ncbi:MAG: DUF3558 family protein [Dietzia sp.]